MVHALALAAALAFTADPPAQAKAAGLTPAEWAKASNGEVVVKGETFKNAEGKDSGRGRAWVVINATADACYATIHKYEDVPQYLPRVKKVSFLDKGETQMRITQEIGVVFSTYRYTMDFTFDPAAKVASWVLDPKVRNDIKDTSGAWKFVPLDDGKTLLDYTVSVDTGMSVPRAISDYMTRKDLPDVLLNFKKRVESGGKWTK